MSAAALAEIAALYRAAHNMAQANTLAEVQQILVQALLASPYPARLLTSDQARGPFGVIVPDGETVTLPTEFWIERSFLELPNIAQVISPDDEPAAGNLAAGDRPVPGRKADRHPGQIESPSATAYAYTPLLQHPSVVADRPLALTATELAPLAPSLAAWLASLANQPAEEGMAWGTCAILPVHAAGRLEIVILVGDPADLPQRAELPQAAELPAPAAALHPAHLSDPDWQLYHTLAELAASALERIEAQRKIERRLSALNTLNSISQAVSTHTDLPKLYQTINTEIQKIFGDTNLLIALYNADTSQIHVPFMYSGKGQPPTSIPAFPMGEGLTSILIRTAKPLLITSNAENRSRQLGAKVVGKPSKSWLGVPLLVGQLTRGDGVLPNAEGDTQAQATPIGAIIVQDLEHEYRYDEDDMHLLVTLAAQVAVAIRNAGLLEETDRRSRRDRDLFTATSQIRSATDIHNILDITANELGRLLAANHPELHIRRVKVSINPQAAQPDSQVKPA